MSNNVVPLRKTSVAGNGKAAFLDACAGSYDKYIEANGHEPDAMMWVFLGLRQTAQTGWLVRGESEGAARELLVLAGRALDREA